MFTVEPSSHSPWGWLVSSADLQRLRRNTQYSLLTAAATRAHQATLVCRIFTGRENGGGIHAEALKKGTNSLAEELAAGTPTGTWGGRRTGTSPTARFAIS